MKRLYWLPAIVLFMVTAHVRAQTSIFDKLKLNGGSDPVAIAAYEARMREADNLRIAGEQALKKGEKAKAIALLLQALKIDANQAPASLLLADIYIKDNRPADVLAILKPVIYAPYGMGSSADTTVEWHMKYILALLDMRRWEEAATLYEKIIGYGPEGRAGNLRCDIPGYASGQHSLPDVHFSPDYADEPGLRAQAHLLLGTRQPTFGLATWDNKITLPYLLDHLKQALKSSRNSLDAQFLIAVVLGRMERYEEARKAFAIVTKNAPREARPEIKAAQAYFDKLEENRKNFDAQEAKRLMEQKAQAQGNAAP